jgi:hypothetical protein
MLVFKLFVVPSVFKQRSRWFPSSRLFLHASYAALLIKSAAVSLTATKLSYQILISPLTTIQKQFIIILRCSFLYWAISYQKDERTKPQSFLHLLNKVPVSIP